MALVAVTAAACSDPTNVTPLDGGSLPNTSPISTTTSASSSASTSSEVETGMVIDTRNDPQLGTILVNEEGFTLYLFANDGRNRSACTGDCAATWPPLLTQGPPDVTGDADDSEIGTMQRANPSGTQVTYAGHPLYQYIDDEVAGDTNGHGVGDVWFAVNEDGEPAGEPEPGED